MKKLCLLLAIILTVTMFSCTNKDSNDNSTDVTTAQKETDVLSTDTSGSSDSTEITTEFEEDKDSETTQNTETSEKDNTETSTPEETKMPETGISGGGSIVAPPSTSAPSSSTAPSKPSVSPEDDKKDYESITCIEPTTKKTVYLASNNINEAICLTMPGDWTLSEASAGGYEVQRSGAKIGSAVYSKSYDHKSCKKCAEYSRFGVKLEHCVQGNASSYVQRLVFTNKGGEKLIFTIDYKYISASTLQTIRNTMRSELKYTDPGLGTLSLSKGNGTESILILGNSFIETSKVGQYLEEMIISSQKNCSVTYISRGYYTLSSYVEDPVIMNDIKSGEYGIVFICGIYGINEVYDLKYMVEACNKSNTILTVFPAHNESEEFINEAKKQYYNVNFLDWKNEIDTFIDRGIAWSNFCRDDEHKHSKPLAGYVGAHMIYRSVFGEIPPSINYVDQTNFENKLGTYVNTGGFPCMVNGSVYYFG